ncbi:Cellobiose 2-epimerase [Polystyrenella longa]|uniref:Cellobiose 2-epimerase n=1 Tax=Polystyrenella longa TaxID=2528007 RepID=A0A518CQ21_9PLAN|nr:thioredoxin domain-containing protein [Polystyrenella longa]QDU81316.1 Cellobiose 2-epimerase [Polystyrenella longa]
MNLSGKRLVSTGVLLIGFAILGGFVLFSSETDLEQEAQAEPMAEPMNDSTPVKKESERKGNRLLQETSPYLLQHAYNPVDWYPWGKEAFEKAKKENKPIFLSIGYSACHWCHVMEHESFENEKIAEYMNEHFICIKVDREERPDVDQIYMNAVVAMTGHGGWPMSVFLKPDLKPFLGGTYWPPQASRGMPGFTDILNLVHNAWENRQDEIVKAGDELTRAVQEMSVPTSGLGVPLKTELLKKAMETLLQAADRQEGGFGNAPKFPHAMDLRLLLRLSERFESAEAREIALLTFDKMAYGGMYDQLGGGFHRYSTDARWLAPHFEKMLYDNALLGSAYLEAWQLTQNPEYERIVRETLDYVLREMVDASGGFYSTQDADSEGVEGKFFVWSLAEIETELGAEDAKLFAACYDVSKQGNWEHQNILNRPQAWDEVAQEQGFSLEELEQQMASAREKLYIAREKRIHPGRDEKILAAWNGLMIATFAQAGRALGEEKYTEAAKRGADFVWNEMRTEEGRLFHSWKEGDARINGFLDDYTNVLDAFTEVYQSTGDVIYLERANELATSLREHFLDKEEGGFFYTSNDHEQLIARPKESQDNATPSGNSMAVTGLLKLSRITGNIELEEIAWKTLESMSGQFRQSTMASGQSLIGLDFHLGPTFELVLVSPKDTTELDSMLSDFYQRFAPNTVVVTHQDGADTPKVLQDVLQGKKATGGEITLYQCEHGSCQKPVHGTDGVKAVLEGL